MSFADRLAKNYSQADFWTKCLRRGPAKSFTAEELLQVAVEYFDWCNDHPLLEQKAFAYKGEITITNVGKMRAFTVHGFCTFVGITDDTFSNYRKEQTELGEAARMIFQIMYTQKLEGAAAELLNANIVSRVLGLAERLDHASEDGSMSPTTIDVDMLSREAKKELLAARARQLRGEEPDEASDPDGE